ncbi:hypothetical protein PEDI_27880 [Persicobacter diffluens]|uniref:Uncharacterized protein n=1 Tax=Persicobacter diffluens TaxID=981 RepID=A0AAN4W026_9BACT|nr:hypothetical protein PEDI_27880 [Persicobacter diffluens]
MCILVVNLPVQDRFYANPLNFCEILRIVILDGYQGAVVFF